MSACVCRGISATSGLRLPVIALALSKLASRWAWTPRVSGGDRLRLFPSPVSEWARGSCPSWASPGGISLVRGIPLSAWIRHADPCTHPQATMLQEMG